MEPFSVVLYELHFKAVIHPFSFAIFGIGGTRNKDAIALLAPVVAAISGVVLACVWLFPSSVAFCLFTSGDWGVSIADTLGFF